MLSCWGTKFYLPINLIILDDNSKNTLMLIGKNRPLAKVGSPA
ncbi:hypothetical protein [Dapis sp. BLCC M229]